MVLLGNGVSTQDPYLYGRGVFWLPTKKSKLYATKDGEEFMEKTVLMSKMGVKIGSGLAVVDMLVRTTPTSVKEVGFRYVKVAAPVTLMAAAFSGGVVISANVTKTDGPLNHFLGGLTAGAVMAAFSGNAKYSSLMGVLLGGGAAIVKAGYQNDMNLAGCREVPRHGVVGFPGHVGRTWDPWRKEVDIESYYRRD